MPTTVTNGNFDTAAAAVPAPYGPLTRVGDVVSAEPNSQYDVECTSNIGSTTVYISYDEMSDDTVATKRLAAQHGIYEAYREFATLVEAVYTYIQTISSTPTDKQFEQMKRVFAFSKVISQLPFGGFYDIARDDKPVADLSLDDTLLVVTPTNNSTGDAIWYAINWGDGNYDVYSAGDDLSDHTYASADTYTVTLYAVGPTGYDKQSQDITVVAT